ncbi:ThuA domain-containing protein [Solwaraspora sp. WMMD1047]|uniref:ThuA domain-containing protein n=1 Tax=Solwaraspora sp. WMMD1047 TaxID=3016102 RepID=UPI002415AF29|nr:ThuA domain-containing protein [Solwaraspora sp. WMMD1047]MDG4828588.1 ThuA domain-containing protein [Solwaraspora sp. WMMD1047]
MAHERHSKKSRFGLSRRRAAVLAAATLLAGLLTATPGTAPDAAAAPPTWGNRVVNVLVFHGPAAEQDDPVAKATNAIRKLGKEHGFYVHEAEDPAVFAAENLARYRSVVFLSANGVTLDDTQEAAFQAYVKSGGGFVGVHDAAYAQPSSEWFTGLIGTRPAASLPDAEEVVEATASGTNPPNETPPHAFDGSTSTKWLTRQPVSWLAGKLATPVAVNRYALTSANDSPGRDPKDWTLQGSNDGESWTDLDRRTGEAFPQRFLTRQFSFGNDVAYQHYRLNITANSGEPLTQLAELWLIGPDAAPPPESQVQEAVVDVTDRDHPANAGLPLKWTRSDQWINWDPSPVGRVHTVAQVEETSYQVGLSGNGPFHPVSWCRDYDGGRSFYLGMGRTEASYTSDDRFRDHLLGAIRWTAGTVRGDCQAGIAANYRTERLTAANQSGQLDQIGEPHGLTIAPDGTVFYIGKAACPTAPVVNWDDPNVGLGCGTIHQWDPRTRQVKLLTTLPVMGHRGSGGELVKNEEGLVGMTLDPAFAENGWFYVYWMPHSSIDREKRIGKRTVSRFTYDAATDTIDQGTRVDLLEWDTQIHSCCHAGGGMTFDESGNLYVGTGDSNSSGGSGGYSGNNWTQEYAGVSFQDARRTSGNTNDLNGKILRIHPEPDGSYTIPDGNLFTGNEEGGGKTRPEIYVMGVRNIARIAWDPVNDWLTAAWVGPDASAPSPELGPAKYETATIITSAGNQGWPYCMGNRQPYRDRSNTDATVLTGWYDCDNLRNESPRNTGLVDIPPARDNMIWFSPQGGGPVYPTRTDGSGLPSYVTGQETFTRPYLRGGSQAVMNGPTYQRSEVDTDSGVAWPAYWNNKWFIGDYSNSGNRVAVTVDPANVPEQGAPALGEDLRAIIQAGTGGTQLDHWMDAKFGPDGALYLLDYGGGFFSLHNNQKLIRITYQGGAATPNPGLATTRAAAQSEPRRVEFSSARVGGVAWEWDFGDGSRPSTQAHPTHTYQRYGTFQATLKVTYADGEVVTDTIDVNVGCVAADTRPTVRLLDTDTGVPNRQAGGGCTINDLIDDERSWPNQGSFTSHLDEVVDLLAAVRIINETEAATLRQAGADSPIGRTPGYRHIFDGTGYSLADWRQAPGGSFGLRPDGSIRSAGGLGMLWYAGQEFADYSVRLKFRDISPDAVRANSGLLVRFPDPRIPLADRPEGSCGTIGSARTSQAWVAIYCGHEIQIYDGETGESQKTGSVYNFSPLTLDRAGATPKGQWNDYEFRVVGQHYTIIRNGVVIHEFDNVPGKQSSRAGDPPTDARQFLSGFLGLQNHGNSDVIEFRDIRVREL